MIKQTAGDRGPSTNGEFTNLGYIARYWKTDHASNGTAWYRNLC